MTQMSVKDPLTESASATLIVVLTTGGFAVYTGHDRVTAPDVAGPMMLHDVTVYGAVRPDEIPRLAQMAGIPEDELREFSRAVAELQFAFDVPAAPSTAATVPDRVFTPDEEFVLPTPYPLLLTADGFECRDHDGHTVQVFSALEADVLRRFVQISTIDDAYESHVAAAGALALERDHFEHLAERLHNVGVLRKAAEETDRLFAAGRSQREFFHAIKNSNRVAAEVDRRVAEHEAQIGAASLLTPVVCVHSIQPSPSLALGMLVAYAEAYDGGRLQEHYDFFPRLVMSKQHLAKFVDRPGIFLFSNYIWSSFHNLELTAEVKRLSPNSITIHGGPDTPKYELDAKRFFAENPGIDIAVRGEGEVTMAEVFDALAGTMGDSEPDLSPLRDVAGLTFRLGDEIVRTEDRERIADLDTIPSPYLTGFFDAHGVANEGCAIIETNRGCPYGCTFCDWGSATTSRIRKFDLERVFAELEWCAQNGMARVGLADANFGIFERDVDIAQKVAELKANYGYPRGFTTNYAKNTVKHLRKIVSVMAEANVLTEGLLSLQSMDESTLSTIRRSNIKTEKYDALAVEFRKAKLPLFVDLMLGLPGSSLDSFRDDLQQCIDRDVNGRIFNTSMLVNSPMNEPSYRETHQIETESILGAVRQDLVVSTSTFTRDDHVRMNQLRELVVMLENHGVLRQLSRYVRQETGVREIAFYEELRSTALADPGRWPAIRFVLESGPQLMVPPVSWQIFIDELRTYLVDQLGMIADSSLETALAVQHALLPSRDREFPIVLDLAHDFGAWHQAIMDAKGAVVPGSWPEHTPRLREMAPATFEISDPNRVCTLGLGLNIENDITADWELESPVSRPTPANHLTTEATHLVA